MDYNNVPNNYDNGLQRQPSNGLAIASMVLGIISIVLGLCYGVGIIFGIVSIILGIMSKKASDGKLSGMALAGIICSVIGIIISIIMLIIVIISFSMASEFSQSQGYDNIYDWFNSTYGEY